MNSDLDEKMEAFISGTLDAQEHENMRLAIENDPAIKAIYEDHLLLVQVVDIMAEEDLVEQLKDLDKQKAQSTSKKNANTFNKWWWFAAILTAAIIIISVFVKRTAELEPTMVAMDYIVYDTDRAIRSQDTLDIQTDQSQLKYFKPLREGIEKMKQSNYPEARSSFQKISEEGIQNIGKSIEIMAEAEGLEAHKNAVSIRLKEINNNVSFRAKSRNLIDN